MAGHSHREGSAIVAASDPEIIGDDFPSKPPSICGGAHFLCGFVPTVRRPYAADDCLCPLIDVNMFDADMLVAAVPEATECLHLP
jgi:hypothetical protein